MNATIQTRIKAWQNMFVLRTCPPGRILWGPQHAERVEAHVRTCPWCRKRKETMSDMQEIQKAGTVLRESLAAQSVQTPVPGQIWTVSSDLGGWDEHGRYLNPPTVLILYPFDDPAPGVRVAQICPEQDLMDGQDILLTSDLGFVQAWNTYALAAEDLEYLLAEVPQELVEAVLEAEEHEAVPEDESSTLGFFRTLELEVGSFVALNSLPKFLLGEAAEEEGGLLALPEPFSDPEHIRKALQYTHSGIQVPVAIQHPLLMAAKSRLPADELPLAAESDKTPFEVTAHALYIQAEGLKLQALRVEVYSPSHTAQGLVFGGTLEELDEEPEALLAWWEDRSEAIVQAEESEMAGEGRMFRISFAKDQAVEPDNGHLIILAVIFHGF